MTTEPKLEAYLAALDKALGPISVSDRADIITEIKSHVLMAQEKNPNEGLSSILASLGEPESVANRYLLERGLKPGKPSKSPMIKWLTIGFLGTFAISCIAVVALVWSFSPLVSVDEKNERVILFGGMIDVNGKEGRVKIGNTSIEGDETGEKFSGSTLIDVSKVKEMRIEFTNGSFEISPSHSNELNWDCRVGKGSQDSFITNKPDTLLVDFSKIEAVKCELEVPNDIKLRLNGANGKLELNELGSETSIDLSNGKIEINADPEKKYKYDVQVTNGKVSGLVSSDVKEAIPVRIRMANGKITAEE